MNEGSAGLQNKEDSLVHWPMNRVTMKDVLEAIKHMKSTETVGISDVAVKLLEHITASRQVRVEVTMEIGDLMVHELLNMGGLVYCTDTVV